MKKYIAGLFIGFALFGGISVHGEGSPHQFSGNVSLNGDHLDRGISQTSEKMALQGGFDYAHTPTGLYAGIWASNVGFSESVEMNMYGGIGGALDNGLVWRAGGFCYLYPSSSAQPEENLFGVYINLAYSFSNV